MAEVDRMPPAKKHTRATAATASVSDLGCAPGFARWITTTSLINGGDLAQLPKFNTVTGGFSHAVSINHSDAFELEPLLITQGPLRGSHALVLKPFTKYFRFLELPLEIRRMIYDALLLDPEPIQISSQKVKGEPTRAFSIKYAMPRGAMRWNSTLQKYTCAYRPNTLAIMAVNRQILQEAAPTMYSGNTFKFTKFSACQMFLTDLGTMRSHLRHIAFFDESYQKTKARGMFFKLKDAKGLRSIAFSRTEFAEVARWRRHTWTAKLLAADCKTMMAALHKSRKDTPNLPSVLDLIKISWRPCIVCDRAGEGADSSTCSECSRRPEVCKTLQKQVREAVAESLGLEE